MRKGLFDKPAPTTNNTEPVKPEYPAVRTPAKGPIITTEDIEPKTAPAPEKKRWGRKPKE
jgi:hypothetical protein